jgi:hypothetical protein
MTTTTTKPAPVYFLRLGQKPILMDDVLSTMRGVGRDGVRHGDMRIGGTATGLTTGIDVYQTNNDDGEMDRFNTYRLGDYVHWNAWDGRSGKRLEGRMFSIDVITGPNNIVAGVFAMVQTDRRIDSEYFARQVPVARLRHAPEPRPTWPDHVADLPTKRPYVANAILKWAEMEAAAAEKEARAEPAPSPAAVFDPYDDLRSWATAHAPLGYVQAQRVLNLLKDYETVQAMLRQAADVVIERCIVGKPPEKTPTFVVTDVAERKFFYKCGDIRLVTTGPYDLAELKKMVGKTVTVTPVAKGKGD